jgi:hypothetical protein
MFTRDLFERMIRAAVAAAAGALAASLVGVQSLDGLRAAVLVAVAAGVSAALSLFARRFGDPDTASFRQKT